MSSVSFGVRLTIGLVLGSSSCSSGTDYEDLRGIRPPTELFEIDAGASACRGESSVGTLVVEYRTRSVGGRFAPRNVGAIWFERDGEHVRTVETWGSTRARYLATFDERAGADTVDAVTSATRVNHTERSVEWDLRDRRGCPLPEGNYTLWMEHTDRNGTGSVVQATIDTASLSVVEPSEWSFEFVEHLRVRRAEP
jgi:hypothetical protein